MIKCTTKRAWLMSLAFILVALLFNLTAAGSTEKVSKLGQYSGYSEPIYDDWTRISQYVTVQEGTVYETKLAMDLFMPTKNGLFFYEYQDNTGQPVTLPVVWVHTIYHRASYLPDGSMYTWLDEQPWLIELLKHGYVVAAVDVRGTGASFGFRIGPFQPVEIGDTYDITEWLAAQPWSNGNVGMFGISYMGITQYFTASGAPPSLKCIFPEMAMFDAYSFVYPGGVPEALFIEMWGYLTMLADLNLPPAYPVVPVDEDVNSTLLEAAIAEHWANTNVTEMIYGTPFRDSVDPISGEQFYFTRSPHTYLDAINNSGIPIYIFNGWADVFSRDAMVWYLNLDTPKKITVGPWEHQGFDYSFHAVEHLRWFDYWLKGIDNGIMQEKPIYYYTTGAPEGREWDGTRKWPIRNHYSQPFFFHDGKTGTVDSGNDGFLKLFPSLSGEDEYTVDYSTTTGFPTRWTNAWEPPPASYGYPDMTYNDQNGLTYTSKPLPFDVIVTGHPVVHLWVSSTAQDGDFYVYLEEIEEDGYSNYITEAVFRASHRKLSQPGFKYMGLPWHRGFAEDLSPLPQEPVELVFDLLPLSNLFDAGNRIRITITCADAGNRYSPELDPPPTIKIYRDIYRRSHVVLPIALKYYW